MISFRNTPIKQKLTQVILLTCGIVLLLTTIMFFAYEFFTFRDDTVRDLSTLGRIIAANSTAALAFGDPDAANEILSSLHVEKHIVAAGLYDRTGNLFAHYPSNLLPSDFPAMPGQDGYEFGDSHLAGFQPVLQGDRYLGAIYLKSNMAEMYERFVLYGVIGLLVIVISLTFAYLLSRLLQRQISRPILRLAETARAVSERRDYSVRATKSGDNELGLLTDAFNHMLSQIQHQNQALSESEAFLKLAERTAGAGAWEFDVTTGATRWSEGCHRVYGTDSKEFVPSLSTWLELIHPDDRNDVDAAVQEALDKHEEFNSEFRIEHPTLGERWLWEIGKADYDEAGNPLRMAGITIDVTEGRQSEEALKSSEERFRTLADNMSQFAWMADSKGWVFWYNQRWYDYTGTTLEEMQGWGWKKVHDPDHVDRVVTKIQHSWDTGEIWEDTFPLRGKDGDYRWFLSRAVPIRDEAGNILRWLGTNTDVTEQMAAEEALKEADRRKDAFLATLAHELRNPLAPIRSGLEIIKMTKNNGTSLEHVRAIMERQLTQMVRLIDDLLDVSRISRGKFELRKEHVALSEVVDSAIETSRPLIEQEKHELTVDVPQKAIFVDADLTRLAQALSNLLNNAARYTDPGGHIWLKVGRNSDKVTISVTDNGTGIETDSLPYIFDLFSQAKASPKHSHGGLGIGLSLVKQLVEMHDGTVEGHSEGPGRGSEFIIHLPVLIAASPKMKAPEQAQVATVSGKRKILIADDNEDFAESLSMMLELQEHEVHVTHDGVTAVEMAKEIRPHLILLDIGMPGLAGHDACCEIRKQPWADKTIIVALTGWGQDEDRLKSKQAGFDYHLVKPVELESLEKVLAELPETSE